MNNRDETLKHIDWVSLDKEYVSVCLRTHPGAASQPHLRAKGDDFEN